MKKILIFYKIEKHQNMNDVNEKVCSKYFSEKLKTVKA